MDRAIPVSSRILQRKKLEKEDEILVERLKLIQRSGSEYYHLEQHKRINRNMQFHKNKEDKIKKDNLRLANKINNIMDNDAKVFNIKKVPGFLRRPIEKRPRSPRRRRNR